MPARQINLLPQDAFTTSTGGKLLYFAITVGRYVVVFTELIVILAFLSRFFLDRRISDLNDRIKQQVAVLDANRDFEETFRFVQGRLTSSSQILARQFSVTLFLDKVTPLVPQDINLTAVGYESGQMSLSGTAPTINDLRQLVFNLQTSNLFGDITLSNVQ